MALWCLQQVDRGLAARVRGKKLWARVKLAKANGEIKMQAKAEAFDILKVEFMGVTVDHQSISVPCS